MKKEDIKQIIVPILQSHHVSRAGLFGSYVRNEHTKASDIDILIQLHKKASLLNFVKIKLDLEGKLNKKVDIIEYSALKPQLKEKILSKEVRIYG